MFDFLRKKEKMTKVEALRIVSRLEYTQEEMRGAGVKSMIIATFNELDKNRDSSVLHILGSPQDITHLNLRVSKAIAEAIT